MTQLRDFLAARSAVSAGVIDEAEARRLLQAFEAEGLRISWLKYLINKGRLDSNKARNVHQMVERFEFFRAEAMYARCAVEAGLDQATVAQARQTQQAGRYSQRVGDILKAAGALDEARHRELLQRTKTAFKGDTSRLLQLSRQHFLGDSSPSQAGSQPSGTGFMKIASPTQMWEYYETAAPAPTQDGPEALLQTMQMSGSEAGFPPAPAPASGRFNPMTAQEGPASGRYAWQEQHPGQGSMEMVNPFLSGEMAAPPPEVDGQPTINFGAGSNLAAMVASAKQAPPPPAPGTGTGQGLKIDLLGDGGVGVEEMQAAWNASRRSAPPSPAPSGVKPVEEWAPGDIIEGRYEILAELGRGAMGAVYRVKDSESGREAALKVAQPKGINAQEIVQRFKREILVTTLVSHENCIEVYDAGELQGAAGGAHFLVMEVVEGEELKNYLAREGKLEAGLAVELIEQLVRGLRACHDSDIVHRDIKPENLQITWEKDGRPRIRIMDFGLSRLLSQVEVVKENVFTSMKTQVSGSPAYMAPEAFTEAADIDFRVDLYAVGVTLFELVTGQLPFPGKRVYDFMEHHLNSSIPLLEDVLPDVTLPRELENLIRKLMAKEKEDRFQTCDEVLVAIEELRAVIQKSKSAGEKKTVFKRLTDLFRKS